MIVKEYGNSKLPKVILIHPMLVSGKTCMRTVRDLGQEYCYIVPDLSAHGEDKTEFISAKKEAECLYEYLKEKNYLQSLF